MKTGYAKKLFRQLVTVLVLLLATVLPVAAATVVVDLTAKQVDLTMPDGTVIPAWVFEDASQVGIYPPVIRATAGDDLTINLTNALPNTAGVGEPVSLMIRGQKFSTAGQWVTTAGVTQTTRSAGDVTSRVRSMAPEVGVGAGPTPYTWTGLRPGTYLVESASHPSVQGPMGLQALLVVADATANQAHGQAFDSEVTLVLQDVDTDLHQAKAAGTYGTPAYPNIMSVGYFPHYFLINGEPYSSTRAPLTTVAPGAKVVLRLANASIRTRVLETNATDIQILAEDGFAYPMSQKAAVLDLPAGKTLDVLLTAPATEGYLYVTDRRLGLTNGSQSNGGYLAYVKVQNPAGTARTLTVAVDAAGSGTGQVAMTSAPGGILCGNGGTDCSETLVDGTEVRLTATPAGLDQGLSGWTVVDTATGTATGECPYLEDCVVSMTADKTVTARFDAYTKIKITAPVKRSIIPADSLVTIRWAAPADAVSFDIFYRLRRGLPWISEARGVFGRSYHWPVPSYVRNFGRVKLAVVGYRADGSRVGVAYSNNSLAVHDTVTLVSPNGGETLNPGDTQTIQWLTRNVSGTIATTALWYQQAPGMPWVTIASLAGDGGGSYTWTVPNITTTQARVLVRFYDAAGTILLSDTSDNPFSIGAPAPLQLSAGSSSGAIEPGSVSTGTAATLPAPGLALVTPNGGEVIPLGGYLTVLWQEQPGAASYSLELSLDGGQTWQDLATGLSANQYDWTVDTKLGASEQTLLRVSAFDTAGKKLASDMADGVIVLQP